MRVSDFELEDHHAALLNANGQRNWLFLALILSLLLHLGLCFYFYRTQLPSTDFAMKAKAPPPMFKVKTVSADAAEKSNLEQPAPAAKPEPDQATAQQPDEKKSFDKLLEEVHATTAMPDDVQDALPETPRVDPASASSVMDEIEKSTAQSLARSPNATREQTMLTDTAVSGRPLPALSGTELATSTTITRPNSFSSKIQSDSAGPAKGRNLGFSDLDSLLAQKGPLGSGTAIRMPDDQLFSYNSSDLQESSISQLRKVATLIQRNPKATFTIEGYTDSFGGYEYNLDLSQRRADAVKEYLVSSMAINPSQIQTRGYGASKFLVPPRPIIGEDEAEIRRQQPNRRVVIVVHTGGD